MTNENILKAYIKDAYKELERLEVQMLDVFDAYEYLESRGLNASHLLLKISTLEDEISMMKETILEYTHQLKKLQGGN